MAKEERVAGGVYAFADMVWRKAAYAGGKAAEKAAAHMPAADRELTYGEYLEKDTPSDLELRRQRRLAKKFSWQVRVGVAADSAPAGLREQTYTAARPLKKMPDAEYVLVCESTDCILRADLLYECVRVLNERRSQGLPSADLIYFDSDSVDPGSAGYKSAVSRHGTWGSKHQTGNHFAPLFRPGFDPDLLSQWNYLGPVYLLRAGMKEITPASVALHIPHILYSAAEPNSAAAEKFPLPVRTKISAKTEQKDRPDAAAEPGTGGGQRTGTGHADPALPQVSVIIPSKDAVPALRRCLDSLTRAQFSDTAGLLEILVVENNSSEQKTFDFYREAQKDDPRVKILFYRDSTETGNSCPGDTEAESSEAHRQGREKFNFSALCNFGASEAKGDLLLFLNNDTELLEERSIRYMAEDLLDPEIGAVGALLFYPDGKVQHAGVILGAGGIAGHALAGRTLEGSGWIRRAMRYPHDVSAVTAAAMMVRAEDFNKMGGFDEGLAVTFNDVDLCLKIGQMGRRILLDPRSRFLHYESLSRGAEESREKVRRFHGEIDRFALRWEKELLAGDPHYSPVLSLSGGTYTLKRRAEVEKPCLNYIRHAKMARAEAKVCTGYDS